MAPPIQNSAVAANNTSAQPAVALNPRLRPQRLFQKVEVAMRIAEKKLEDHSQMTIGEWISDEDMQKLQLTIRDIIRKHYDATFDAWPARVQHDYLPDVREAIIQGIHKAINEKWSSFQLPPMDGQGEKYDEFVATDFVKPGFWTQ